MIRRKCRREIDVKTKSLHYAILLPMTLMSFGASAWDALTPQGAFERCYAGDRNACERQGRGDQARINAALRAFVEVRERARSRETNHTLGCRLHGVARRFHCRL